jgi:NAD(P)-dependent dehydrogenase (short-subunit alcohol dehydrogenase family)
MKIQDKVCVVTGAAGGIGEAIAAAFVRAGAKGVVIADLDASRIAETAQRIGAVGVTCNVAIEAEIKRLIETTEARFGPIDVFFSNAGIALPGHEAASDQAWADSWAVHVMSHVYAARALIPGMLARGSGYLLNTASAAGLLASMSSAPYAVTKHAAVALAEHFSIHYRDRGIVSSVLCPQAVDTAMYRGIGTTAAGLDGIMTPAAVAEVVLKAMEEERFLILSHPIVQEYVNRKANNIERWLAGMRRLLARTAK